MVLTNPERWERIRGEAKRTGQDPYKLLEAWLKRDPAQFKSLKKILIGPIPPDRRRFNTVKVETRE